MDFKKLLEKYAGGDKELEDTLEQVAQIFDPTYKIRTD